jgi:methionyl-tRNA formyltransferase
LFFGTSDFAVPSLRVLAARTTVSGVVTQPDRPSGRGHKATPSPVKKVALQLGISVHEPHKLGELRDALAGERYDLFALASYGRIVPAWLLALPRLGALNVHPSMLPAYRGATPIQTALRNGDETTGVTIMLMDEGMDTGNIVLQQPVAIEPGENYGELTTG